MWAGLLGFDGSVQLVDPVDELRVGLDELGSCLLRSFELERLAAEPGPLGFENPSVRFGRVLPGTLSGVQGGGAGRETSAAAVSGEEEIGTGPSPPVWTSSSGDYREATRDKRAIIHGGKKDSGLSRGPRGLESDGVTHAPELSERSVLCSIGIEARKEVLAGVVVVTASRAHVPDRDEHRVLECYERLHRSPASGDAAELRGEVGVLRAGN